MVGGLFAGLIAPFTFSWIAEYPILLALAALCRPPRNERCRAGAAMVLAVLAVTGGRRCSRRLIIGGKVIHVARRPPRRSSARCRHARDAAGGVLRADRWKIAATVVLALAMIRAYPSDDGRVETVRSFFGVHKIVVTPDDQYHVLMHGTTIHGAEKFQNDDGTPVTGRPEPISYYHKDGGIGQAITAIRERKGGPIRVAVIGLGSGTLTCAVAARRRLEILRDRPDRWSIPRAIRNILPSSANASQT